VQELFFHFSEPLLGSFFCLRNRSAKPIYKKLTAEKNTVPKGKIDKIVDQTIYQKSQLKTINWRLPVFFFATSAIFYEPIFNAVVRFSARVFFSFFGAFIGLFFLSAKQPP
jgi:hypothetical protein